MPSRRYEIGQAGRQASQQNFSREKPKCFLFVHSWIENLAELVFDLSFRAALNCTKGE